MHMACNDAGVVRMGKKRVLRFSVCDDGECSVSGAGGYRGRLVRPGGGGGVVAVSGGGMLRKTVILM